MPALLGPLVGFALGVALAFLVRAEAERDDSRNRSARLAIVALFGALVFAPASGYFLLFAPDWALFYLIDSRAVPSALLLCIALLDAASVPLGYMAGRNAARKRAFRALITLGAAPAAIAFGLVLAFLPKLRLEGTYHQIKGDFGTQPVAGSALGFAILWMTVMLVAGVVLTARAIDPQSRLGASRAPFDPNKPPQPTSLLGQRRR